MWLNLWLLYIDFGVETPLRTFVIRSRESRQDDEGWSSKGMVILTSHEQRDAQFPIGSFPKVRRIQQTGAR